MCSMVLEYSHMGCTEPLTACLTLTASKFCLLCMGNFLKIAELKMAMFLLSGCHHPV